MRHRDPRTRLADVVRAYRKALHSGTFNQYASATQRLYDVHGRPFGQQPHAMLLWLRYGQWTTGN